MYRVFNLLNVVEIKIRKLTNFRQTLENILLRYPRKMFKVAHNKKFFVVFYLDIKRFKDGLGPVELPELPAPPLLGLSPPCGRPVK